MWSATVASPRRKAAADRTRGAWPQSVRALAEKTSIVVCDVAGRKRMFTAKKVDGRALVKVRGEPDRHSGSGCLPALLWREHATVNLTRNMPAIRYNIAIHFFCRLTIFKKAL